MRVEIVLFAALVALSGCSKKLCDPKGNRADVPADLQPLLGDARFCEASHSGFSYQLPDATSKKDTAKTIDDIERRLTADGWTSCGKNAHWPLTIEGFLKGNRGLYMTVHGQEHGSLSGTSVDVMRYDGALQTMACDVGH